MIKELLSTFPKSLEQKINALLEIAEPNPAKAFQLYKTCQREELWSQDFESFKQALSQYYSHASGQRNKSFLDQVLERPIHSYLMPEFSLNFKNAQLDSYQFREIVSWAHHLLRVHFKTDSAVVSMDTLNLTLTKLTQPGFNEKDLQLTFIDFCTKWKDCLNSLFGKTYDREYEKISSELKWHYHQQELEVQTKSMDLRHIPLIYLTQTEIDWVDDVLRATVLDLAIAKFPLSRGPQKQRLIDLERTISLYKIVQTSKAAEFKDHRDNIRATIIDRCRSLLKDCAR